MAARGVSLSLSRLVSTNFAGVLVAPKPIPAAQLKVGTVLLRNRPKFHGPRSFQQSFHTSLSARCDAELDGEQPKVAARDPTKVRDQVIPVETSIAYLESEGT